MEMFSDLERPPLPDKKPITGQFVLPGNVKGQSSYKKTNTRSVSRVTHGENTIKLGRCEHKSKKFLILKFSLKRTVFLKQRYQQYVLEVIIYEPKCSSTKIENRSIY